jgi:hypothetical protein
VSKSVASGWCDRPARVGHRPQGRCAASVCLGGGGCRDLCDQGGVSPAGCPHLEVVLNLGRRPPPVRQKASSLSSCGTRHVALLSGRMSVEATTHRAATWLDQEGRENAGVQGSGSRPEATGPGQGAHSTGGPVCAQQASCGRSPPHTLPTPCASLLSPCLSWQCCHRAKLQALLYVPTIVRGGAGAMHKRQGG